VLRAQHQGAMRNRGALAAELKLRQLLSTAVSTP
jgi:hypothetical protein